MRSSPSDLQEQIVTIARRYSPYLHLTPNVENPEDLRATMRGLFKRDLMSSSESEAKALMTPNLVSPGSQALSENPMRATGPNLKATPPLRMRES